MAGGDASADASRRAGSARDAASSSRPPKPLWRWHPSRGRPDERDDDPRWLARRKHFFILSDAGKPVWSRYGDAANLSGFAAAVSAMLASASEQLCRSSVDASERSVANERVVSFALDGEKSGTSRVSSRSSTTGCRVVCLSRNGLTYVALSRVPGESRAALTRQLRLLRYQTLFVLTSAVERAVLRSGSKFDPRRLLRDETGGADAALGALAHAATWDPGAFLGAWAPLPFSNTKRTLVHRALQRALCDGTSGDLTRRTNAKRARVFAAVVATATHVVAVAAKETRLVKKKRDALPAHPDDVYLLTHFARHVGAFRANDETFAPVCLPRRDPNTFAHAHVSFLSTREPMENENDAPRGTFLVLVADEGGPDAFHAVRRCKEDVEKALRFKHAGLNLGGGGSGSGSLSLLDAIERRVAFCKTPRGIEPPAAGSNPRPGAVARGSTRLADEVPRAAGGGGENRRVLHFLYVRPPLGQYVAPEWAAPLDGRDAQKKTLRAYRRVADAVSSASAADEDEDSETSLEPREEVGHRRAPSRDGSQTSERGGGGGGGVHAGLTSFFQGLGLGGGVSARSGSGSPSGGARAGGRDASRPASGAAKGDKKGERRKVHFESSAARVLLGFAGGDFELYVAMAPGTSRADAVAACNRLCTWLRQEEPRLFAAAA